MFDHLRKGLGQILKKVSMTEITESKASKVIIPLKDLLIKNELAVSTADIICDELKKRLIHVEHNRFSSAKQLVAESLRAVLLDLLLSPDTVDILKMVQEAKEEKNPFIIALFGINGVGKTLTVAKLGKYFENNGFSVVFAAGDTFRAGSIQQLQQHGEKLDVRVIAQTYGSDSAAVAFDAINHARSKNVDIVLIDTAGRMETNKNLMAELKKICKVTEPDLKLFVGDALTGNALVSQVQLFNKEIGIDASIINKMDADVKGGAVVTVINITKKPILFIGNGQKYTHLEVFDPHKIVDYIVPK